jgi:hypothetical protein
MKSVKKLLLRINEDLDKAIYLLSSLIDDRLIVDEADYKLRKEQLLERITALTEQISERLNDALSTLNQLFKKCFLKFRLSFYEKQTKWLFLNVMFSFRYIRHIMYHGEIASLISSENQQAVDLLSNLHDIHIRFLKAVTELKRRCLYSAKDWEKIMTNSYNDETFM